MVGRRLCSEQEATGRGFGSSDCAGGCCVRRSLGSKLDTLRAHGIRHVVLGAFGCGAFCNPADRVAAIYRDEIAARAADFSVIAFAIFSAGSGPDNFTPFAKVWGYA
jgi:hypothetical protein